MGPVTGPEFISVAVTIEVPPSGVFERWRAFDEFPHFMRGGEDERGLDGSRMLWRIHFDGAWLPWDAEVGSASGREAIYWSNKAGSRPCRNAGSVTFKPHGPGGTRLALCCEFDPGPQCGRLDDSLEELAARLGRGLERFQGFVMDGADPWEPLGGLPLPRWLSEQASSPVGGCGLLRSRGVTPLSLT